ncbi:hypothetical protein [Actinopolymorpha pittospori]|uniref:Uncharacterized protein n=1 Tax=Actinopolymorpha pittospori TaxID=648752 RepID=A0A927N5I7_9ACTN|nr:hypothetical protein [Actinopolymorpha pittospori]MBE1612067.1 hypothetical protein [Actinopolymorpha pittospori]
MNWADTTSAAAFDDVLLPLEFEDLARSKPRPGSSVGYRAAWLLRKAALFDRLASTDPTQADTALTVAGRAREAGRRLQAQLVDALAPELATGDERPASQTASSGLCNDMTTPREEAA